eukprot:3680428-Rhodomonas_salina.1
MPGCAEAYFLNLKPYFSDLKPKISKPSPETRTPQPQTPDPRKAPALCSYPTGPRCAVRYYGYTPKSNTRNRNLSSSCPMNMVSCI